MDPNETKYFWGEIDKDYDPAADFASGKVMLHLWYSPKQHADRLLTNCPGSYCNIDGKITAYTEAKETKEESNYPDAVYLGEGTYHGTNP